MTFLLPFPFNTGLDTYLDSELNLFPYKGISIAATSAEVPNSSSCASRIS